MTSPPLIVEWIVGSLATVWSYILEIVEWVFGSLAAVWRVMLEIVSSVVLQIPVYYRDLSWWMAVTAVILLITCEITSLYHGRMGIMVDRRKLKIVTWTFSLLFLMLLAIQIYLGITEGNF